MYYKNLGRRRRRRHRHEYYKNTRHLKNALQTAPLQIFIFSIFEVCD